MYRSDNDGVDKNELLDLVFRKVSLIDLKYVQNRSKSDQDPKSFYTNNHKNVKMIDMNSISNIDANNIIGNDVDNIQIDKNLAKKLEAKQIASEMVNRLLAIHTKDKITASFRTPKNDDNSRRAMVSPPSLIMSSRVRNNSETTDDGCTNTPVIVDANAATIAAVIAVYGGETTRSTSCYSDLPFNDSLSSNSTWTEPTELLSSRNRSTATPQSDHIDPSSERHSNSDWKNTVDLADDDNAGEDSDAELCQAAMAELNTLMELSTNDEFHGSHEFHRSHGSPGSHESHRSNRFHESHESHRSHRSHGPHESHSRIPRTEYSNPERMSLGNFKPSLSYSSFEPDKQEQIRREIGDMSASVHNMTRLFSGRQIHTEMSKKITRPTIWHWIEKDKAEMEPPSASPQSASSLSPSARAKPPRPQVRRRVAVAPTGEHGGVSEVENRCSPIVNTPYPESGRTRLTNHFDFKKSPREPIPVTPYERDSKTSESRSIAAAARNLPRSAQNDSHSSGEDRSISSEYRSQHEERVKTPNQLNPPLFQTFWGVGGALKDDTILSVRYGGSAQNVAAPATGSHDAVAQQLRSVPASPSAMKKIRALDPPPRLQYSMAAMTKDGGVDKMDDTLNKRAPVIRTLRDFYTVWGRTTL